MIAVDRYKGVIRYERPKASALATNEKDKIIFLYEIKMSINAPFFI